MRWLVLGVAHGLILFAVFLIGSLVAIAGDPIGFIQQYWPAPAVGLAVYVLASSSAKNSK